MKKRVVITGIGGITPIGNKKDDLWKAVVDGKSGIGKVTYFDIRNYPCTIAAQVKSFNVTDYIDKKLTRKMDKFSQFAVSASIAAISDAGISISDIAERTGVIIGTAMGGFGEIEYHLNEINRVDNCSKVSPFFIFTALPNIASGYIGIITGAKYKSFVINSACASSTNAIGESYKLIINGEADVMIAGGAEAAISPTSFAGYCSLKAMSTRNDLLEKACSPFDIKRDGFVMGEGAVILILEELEHALSRKASIIAEIIGYGTSSDAYHITAPDPQGKGAVKAMKQAIDDADIPVEYIDYINAHGTSTRLNDEIETLAIKDVFAHHAYQLAVSSTKPLTGHMMGAAGAMEAAICAMGLKDGFIPPTLNLDDKDPACDLDYVAISGRYRNIRYALSNSFGFGGHNASLILKRF